MGVETARRPSPVTVKNASNAVGEAFLALRAAIGTAATLDAKTQELILLSGFLVARQESGFKAHCKRALENGASADDVRTAVLVNLGAVASIELVADALNWADDVLAART